MKAIIWMALLIFLWSCNEKEDKPEEYNLSEYCTATEGLSISENRDSLRQLLCSLLRLYNEPCLFSSEKEANVIRLITSIPNDYSIIYRISRTQSCDIVTFKRVPPSLLSIFNFYSQNRMVSYKMYEFPIEKSVFDRIKTEISNLRPVQEFDGIVPDKYKSYTLEYYHDNRYMVNDTSDVFKGMDMAPIEKILMEYMPKDDGEALYGRLRRRPGEF